MNMMKLSTPKGTIYIRKDTVIAVGANKFAGQNDAFVKTSVWVEGQEDPFNILEDVEAVFSLLA